MIPPLKLTLAAAALVAASSLALAEGARPGEPGFPGTPAPSATTWRKTCAQIQGLVNSRNQAILTYSTQGFDGSNLFTTVMTMGNHTWDRVVKDQRFCLYGETTQPIWVPTRDNPQCFAGYTCESGNSGRWR
ncbi:MAG: hypothetical protein LCH61_01465 [Proteobacteria bacterium]|nr:hypothetical protein [Pseudomonadota bacterium]